MGASGEARGVCALQGNHLLAVLHNMPVRDNDHNLQERMAAGPDVSHGPGDGGATGVGVTRPGVGSVAVARGPRRAKYRGSLPWQLSRATGAWGAMGEGTSRCSGMRGEGHGIVHATRRWTATLGAHSWGGRVWPPEYQNHAPQRAPSSEGPLMREENTATGWCLRGGRLSSGRTKGVGACGGRRGTTTRDWRLCAMGVGGRG